MKAEDATCLPCHPITWVAPLTHHGLDLLAAGVLDCYEDCVACGKYRIEGRQEETATGTDCRGANIGQQ